MQNETNTAKEQSPLTRLRQEVIRRRLLYRDGLCPIERDLWWVWYDISDTKLKDASWMTVETAAERVLGNPNRANRIYEAFAALEKAGLMKTVEAGIGRRCARRILCIEEPKPVKVEEPKRPEAEERRARPIQPLTRSEHLNRDNEQHKRQNDRRHDNGKVPNEKPWEPIYGRLVDRD